MILDTLGRFRLYIPGVRGLITLENVLLLSGFKSGDSLFFTVLRRLKIDLHLINLEFDFSSLYEFFF